MMRGHRWDMFLCTFYQSMKSQVRKEQWIAFTKRLKDAGRPIGPAASAEERNRQAYEFYQFCGGAP